MQNVNVDPPNVFSCPAKAKGCEVCHADHATKACPMDPNKTINVHGATLGQYRDSNFKGTFVNFKPRTNVHVRSVSQEPRFIQAPAAYNVRELSADNRILRN